MTHVDNTQEYQRIISFCTGIGGIERGLARTGMPIRTVCYVEIEAFLCENLVAGMEAGLLAQAPIWTDLKTFDGKPFRGMVDGITGGYPCPPFSTAGKRLGSEDPRHLYPHIERHIDTIRPIWCFFENVSGHLSLGFDEVYRSLSAMGYSVEAGIFTAEEVGAPHQRERLFILAIMADAKGSDRGIYSRWRRSREGEVYTGRAGEELGNAKGDNERRVRECGSGGCQPSGGSGAEMDNAAIIRQQIKRHNGKSTESCHPRFIRTGSIRWPAGPGQPQHAWEAPRTIEPGMGLAAYGYRFREDILRALGNGVVEQTAELAFKTLLKKHFEQS